MKRKFICIYFISIFLLVFSGGSYATENAVSSLSEQWFIQIGAFTSVDNAVAFQQKAQSQVDKTYSLEREFTSYVTIHPNGSNYRVLLGAYPTKEDAQTAQSEISEIFPNAVVIKSTSNEYFNYRYGYQLTWFLIDKNVYENLRDNSVSFLDTSNFEMPSLSKQVSLIAHTQIKGEIFDLKEAQALLKQDNVILHLDKPDSPWLTGYEIDGKYSSTIWPFMFYAYYPSEKLLVLWGEGESLIGLSTATGEFTWKLPFSILYSPDKRLRISGEDFGEIGGGRSFVEVYDTQQNYYVELIDIGIVSPWFLNKTTGGFAWLSDNEVIFILTEMLPTQETSRVNTRYYRVTIDPIAETK